ncbi:hypothetical protein ES708_23536 [subsurface metagenome]
MNINEYKIEKSNVYILYSIITFFVIYSIILFLPDSDKTGIIGSIVCFTIVSIIIIRAPKIIRQPLFVAFLLRFILAFLVHYIPFLYGYNTNMDGFESRGWGLAMNWHQGVQFKFIFGAHTYSMIIGMIYYLIGRSPLFIRMVNVFLSTMIVFNTFKIALLVWQNKRTVKIATWIVAFFPSLILFGVTILREAILVYLLTVSILYLIAHTRNHRISSLFISLIALLMVINLNSGFFLILIVPVFLLIKNLMKLVVEKKSIKILYISVIFIIFLIATIVFINSFLDVSIIGEVRVSSLTDFTIFEKISSFQNVAARGRAAYLVGKTTSSPVSLLIWLPIRIIYFLFMPFPWIWCNLMDILGGVDAFLYFWIIFYSFRGLFQKKSKFFNYTTLWIIILTAGIGISVFSAGTSNYGTAWRHRAVFAFLFAILAASPLSLYRFKNINKIEINEK